MFFLLPFLFAALISAAPLRKLESDLKHYTFDKYQENFGYSFCEHSGEYAMRKNLFETKLQEVIQHNQDKTKTWKIALNKLSVLNESELKAMRGGYHATKQMKNYASVHTLNLTAVNNAPVNIDWRTKGVITPVKNQGQCGSCWSFGAAETLESYWALATKNLVVLSEQQILDCTPNPNSCGGTGGCGGGTVELAYARIKAMGGLTSEANYPYTSGAGSNEACQTGNLKPVAKLSGFVNLPPNQLNPILNYLQYKGPLAINVDASSWSSYSSGVFDGCDQTNPDIDHVVQLVGAGTDPNYGNYWLVRNSWSDGWGENGYIRLRRTSTPRCGIDNTPSDGTGCSGGPGTVQVCGTCGILYDALFPTVSP